jgi:membrane fusion protein (multidrug efflux system)
LSQINPAWARFALAEADVAKLPGGRLAPDAEVRLILGDGTRHPARGRINFAASQVDVKLGTRQMRAEFENGAAQLLPGQFVRVEVLVNRPQTAYLLPQTAVLQNEKGHFVFALDGGNKAAIKQITVGEWLGSDWTVLGGLAPGDRVVLDNLFKMQPGVTVQPIAAEAAATAAPAPAKP